MTAFVCHSVVLCDDVRIEQNNKFILIGVYSNGVAVKEMPATIFLTVWATISFSEVGKHTFFFELHGNKGDIIKMTVELDVHEVNGPIPIVTPKRPITFEEPDEIRVLMGFDLEKLEEVAHFPIKLDPSIPDSNLPH